MNLLIREKEIIACVDREMPAQYFADEATFSYMLRYPEKALELRRTVGEDMVVGCVTKTEDSQVMSERFVLSSDDSLEECNQRGGVFNVPCRSTD